MTNKITEALKLAEKMAKRHGVRMCDENGDTHGEELYCVGIDDIADIIREALADHIADAGKVIAEPVKQEPVAWWNGKETTWFEHELCGWQAPDDCTIPLYAAPVDAKAIRDEALEEAKKACDEICQKAIDSGYTVKGETFIDGFGDGACACAAAIGGLK